MAEIQNAGGGGKEKVRAKKHSTKIDMTPMVDLAFLLLTFFILTTTLAEQRALDIILPAKTDEDTSITKVNNAITVILSEDNRIFYYEDELKTSTKMTETDFKGIRTIIAKKNKAVIENLNTYYKQNPKARNAPKEDSVVQKQIKEIHSDKRAAFVIIKYDSLARYRNAIDIVDEMDICGVPPGKYALVPDLQQAEKVMIANEKIKKLNAGGK